MKRFLIIPLLAIAILLYACSENKTQTKEVVKPMNRTWTTDTGLQIEVLQEGNGEVAVAGNTVSVHYTGWLTDGKKFDSSIDRNRPYNFKLGDNKVIKGWEQGVVGMKPGEKRKLTIPSDLGYGPNGYPDVIPPNATLIFEVELLKTK
jgi:FKBP-type peptidyl-prolyl cis-trans isomerase FkpA